MRFALFLHLSRNAVISGYFLFHTGFMALLTFSDIGTAFSSGSRVRVRRLSKAKETIGMSLFKIYLKYLSNVEPSAERTCAMALRERPKIRLMES